MVITLVSRLFGQAIVLEIRGYTVPLKMVAAVSTCCQVELHFIERFTH